MFMQFCVNSSMYFSLFSNSDVAPSSLKDMTWGTWQVPLRSGLALFKLCLSVNLCTPSLSLVPSSHILECWEPWQYVSPSVQSLILQCSNAAAQPSSGRLRSVLPELTFYSNCSTLLNFVFSLFLLMPVLVASCLPFSSHSRLPHGNFILILWHWLPAAPFQLSLEPPPDSPLLIYNPEQHLPQQSPPCDSSPPLSLAWLLPLAWSRWPLSFSSSLTQLLCSSQELVMGRRQSDRSLKEVLFKYQHVWHKIHRVWTRVLWA